ncbi:MAG: PSD1 domain-containing protein [Verrucomicrobiae bacterium]|nr:PSD1 domain-containing protein [Verrucomicrobiae bacterium]
MTIRIVSPAPFAFPLLVMVLAMAPAREGISAPVFEKDVRPILKAHCFHCHGEDGEKKGDLDVRLTRFLLKGGESGPALVPGKPAGSHLLELIKNGEMPKEKAKLPERDIATIEQWILAGAPTARPEPETLGAEPQFTEEERSWWSLQPIRRPDVPAKRDSRENNPIDAFVRAKLDENGLSFSDEADAATLERRLAYDLSGLPPGSVDPLSPAAGNGSPFSDEEWGKLVDRYLASPAYGERWGRHWLDVAGYADSDGFNEKDTERPHAWRFRDYVINALNADKPFDEFVREQLAGDEIAAKLGLNADAPTSEGRARYAELMAATGFLRMAPDGTASENTLLARNASITDTLKIVSTAFYGMTIQCAECHDHRYDPITQKDFYELRAVFEPGFQPAAWRLPAQRLVSLRTKEDKAAADAIEAEAKKIDDARLIKQEEFISEVLEKELAKREEAVRDPLRKAFRAAAKDRTPEQLALLKQHPSVEKLSAGSLYLYDTTYKTKHADTLKKMTEEAAAVRAKKPKEDLVQAFAELPAKPGAIPATHLFHRGNPESPKDAVTPSDLDVFGDWRKAQLPENREDVPTTGRRLAFAEMLTDGTHPLLARVIVNRVWMHHFGTGLVKTPADFGHLGETPSHPELLDWLASEFMAKGWSLKELHRLILNSHTWRQQSDRDAKRDLIDPDNRLLSRQNKKRLEAEVLRDALLVVSGKLNPKRGGTPVPVMLTEEGQVVLGVDTMDTAGRQTGKYIPLNGEEFRRSVYVQIRRSRPLEMFATFDAPDMTTANCEIRPVTTVSPQSLLLMNNLGMREFAQYFGERLFKECGDAPVEEQVRRAWQIVYGRDPVSEELESGIAFLTMQTAHYMVEPARFEKSAGPIDPNPAPARVMGFAALGHALMSANEFLYLD